MRRIERSAGQRAGYKQLVRELGLGGGRERRLLLEQLARITARGELVKTEIEQWALPAATSGEDGAGASGADETAREGARSEWRQGDAGPAGGGAAGSASRWVWVCAAEWEREPRGRSVYSAE